MITCKSLHLLKSILLELFHSFVEFLNFLAMSEFEISLHGIRIHDRKYLLHLKTNLSLDIILILMTNDDEIVTLWPGCGSRLVQQHTAPTTNTYLKYIKLIRKVKIGQSSCEILLIKCERILFMKIFSVIKEDIFFYF